MNMLRFSLLFLVLALLAGLFGFGFVANSFMDAAKVFFLIFTVLALITFLGGSHWESTV